MSGKSSQRKQILVQIETDPLGSRPDKTAGKPDRVDLVGHDSLSSGVPQFAYGMDAVQFTSVVFVVFLLVVFVAYWCARNRQTQNIVVLLASYFFYGWWDYRFLALILFSSLVDFLIGQRIGRNTTVRKRRTWLILSLISNLGLLAIFKYFGFFAENLEALATSIGWQLHPVTLNIVLPVGISFYTFQTLSYTIDVYRKELEPSRNLLEYLAFVSFFPQLVAGPIERGKDLLPQFQKFRLFDRTNAEDGCRWILWGFFKKLAIADPLASTVDRFYMNWESATGTELTLATVCFAFQIYCDFSAYSDIAIGTAKLFSIKLRRNFAYPYFSQSISEFWRRWHMSLSTWFRDYVYIPMGGSQVSSARRNLNIMATFVLSGLWHGAAWTFVAWGGVHGATLAGEKTLSNGNPKRHSKIPGGDHFIPRPMTILKIGLTFTIVCCGWVFFRAESISSAFSILGRMFTDTFSLANISAVTEMMDAHSTITDSLVLLAMFVAVEWIRRAHACPLSGGRSWLMPVRWATYTFLIWGSLDMISKVDEQPFVYFAF